MHAVVLETYLNLPSAFSEVEKLAAELLALMRRTPEHATSFSRLKCTPELDAKFREMQHALKGVFDDELRKQNFTIFHHPHILVLMEEAPGMLGHLTDQKYGDQIFQGLIKSSVEQKAAFRLYRILEHYGPLMSEKVVSSLWRAVKELTQEQLNQSLELSPLTRDILPKLFDTTKLDEDAMAELSKLILLHADLDTIQNMHWELLSNGGDALLGDEDHLIEKSRFYASTLKFKAVPYMVKLFNISFFEAQLSRRGIDKASSELLVYSWQEDFSSFLDAAESLSADKQSPSANFPAPPFIFKLKPQQ